MGISLFKLLKSELPGLVREVQSTQVNLTLSLKSHINLITLEKKVEVMYRMEDGQTQYDVCRSMELSPLVVSTIMKNTDKIQQSLQHATTVSAMQVSYSRSQL